MKTSYFVFLILVVFSCKPKNVDERNAADIKARADSLAMADSIRLVSAPGYRQLNDPGTDDHDNSIGTGWLQLIGDSVRVVGSGDEILMFRFPNGQSLDEDSDNKAQGYLELTPKQQTVVSSVRFVFTIGGLKCDDVHISSALGADPDTTYMKTIHNIQFKVSEVGLGGRNPTDYTLYQFAYNNVCLSFLMEAVDALDASADANPGTYKSIETIFEDFLGSLKMK